MIHSIDALFAPIGAAAFFAHHYEKAPLCLRAEDDARTGLLSHDDLLRALAAADPASEGLVVFPEYVGKTKDELLSNPNLSADYFDAGHPLVWNRARGVSPAVDALCALLADAFGGHVWPNVYATGTAGTPFDMHFDAHEVIAIQCEGEKTWTMSEVRVDRPIEAREMEGAVKHALTARREEASARTLCSYSTRPGDLVYIPRGQFHNAKASAGRSLHVTFGIELPTAFDVLKRMIMDMIADPRMREYVPPLSMDPEEVEAAATMADMASRASRLMAAEVAALEFYDLRARWMEKSGGKRGG